jgi:hypothetical protein
MQKESKVRQTKTIYNTKITYTTNRFPLNKQALQHHPPITSPATSDQQPAITHHIQTPQHLPTRHQKPYIVLFFLREKNNQQIVKTRA